MSGHEMGASEQGTPPPLVILAAGGTGGHMFPAEALARVLLDRGFRVALVTDQRGQAFGDSLGVPTYRIHAGRLRRDLIDRIRALGEMALGGLDAGRLIRTLKPAAIVGFGGYPSIPTVIAGFFSRIPVVLHEQNAVLGRSNRRLANRARVVATGFARVERVSDGVRTSLTGNPVRPGILAVRDRPYQAPAAGGTLSLLVTGGSQGAHIFSEVVPAALGMLTPAQRARLSIVQQCRPEDLSATSAAYEAIGVTAELAGFFSDMPDRLAAAHLVVCRAGASSVAELGVAGRPAILVPYPFATDDHQTANAKAFAEDGGAWVIGQRAFTPIVLAERISALLADPRALDEAAGAARTQGRPDAASRLADLVAQQIAPRLPAGRVREEVA